eukprot:TRINITY_DN502_c0_g3_i3.p2 TRINITY_DN502_c0_g3~~TRINITY_DN502_c0_g3_i3.p2  ORF type:complete len:258 (-),score=23.37 TRINITY_DN502_c0_g3_i3:692-1465(-)
MSTLFKRQAHNYLKFRPVYPQQLYDTIFEFSGKAEGEVVVDVATGNGQVANQLSKYFQNVVGIDSSEEQISFAITEKPNVTFQVGDCHQLPFEDSSVDLVTIATALHWFDLDKFYKEVTRVLKPGGTFAAWTYKLQKFKGYPEASNLLNQYVYEHLKDYWDERAMKVVDGYEGMEPKEPLFYKFKKLQLEVEQKATLYDTEGFVSTLSSYNTYMEKKEKKDDSLIQLVKELQSKLDFVNVDQELDIYYPIVLLLGKK